MGVYQGVIVPMVTPFTESGDVDEGALRSLVNHLIEHGVHGLFPAGSTGEAWSLSPAERRRIFEVVCEEARGRVPVMGGTGAISTRATIELTRVAKDVGCCAAVLITPYYITPTQEELFDHYKAIAQATGIDIIPYNNPNRTSVNMSAKLAASLSRVPNIVGIKDSSGDLGLTLRFVCETASGFSILQGRDDLFYPSLAMGVHGIVACVANMAPGLTVEFYDAFARGDHARALEMQVQLAALRRALSLGTFPAVIKAAMEMVGVKAGPARHPVGCLSGEAKEELRGILRTLNLL